MSILNNSFPKKQLLNCAQDASAKAILPSRPIVFIDAAVDDIPLLLEGMVPRAEVVLLDSDRDGVVQITAALQAYSDISAIHIVSHGSPGCLYLGNIELSLDTLDRYRHQLKTWTTNIAPLLLYGCNVAAGDAGYEFIEKLHYLTDTKIAASATRTGNSATGGDWNLEVTTDKIAEPLAFSMEVRKHYTSVLNAYEGEERLTADLVVTVSTANSIEPGEDLSPIEVRVKNIGNTRALGSESAGAEGYFVDLVLSSDTEVPKGFASFSPNYSEDVLLLGGRLSNTPDLKPGEEFVFTTSAGIPTDTPDGNYFIAAQIDSGQKVPESNEKNNVSFSPLQIASNPPEEDNDFVINVSEISGFELLDQPLQIDEGLWFLGTGPNPEELQLRLPTNANAADTTNTDQLWPNGALGLNLSGSGLTVGVWEAGDGYVRDTHQEFTGRVTFGDTPNQERPSRFTDHATIVAGTIAAAGVDPRARGMANQVNIISYTGNNYIQEIRDDAQRYSIVVSNHSFGLGGGWAVLRWDLDNQERNDNSGQLIDTWLGDLGQFVFKETQNGEILFPEGSKIAEDSKYGQYTSTTKELDEALFDNPYLLSVFSAGNERDNVFGGRFKDSGNTFYATASTKPLPGTPLKDGDASYYLVNTKSFSAPLKDGNAGTGFDSLSTEQVAKNTLVVGAIEDNLNDDPIKPETIKITEFSSYGPTDDGRIKPDVVANGKNLYSSLATDDDDYLEIGNSGTSLSAPNVTGTAVLLIEHYNNLFSDMPRSATTKGLLIHTATDAGNVGPDYSFGWGLVNAAEAANFLTRIDENDPGNYFDEISYSGTEQTINVVSDGGTKNPLKATIVWTDPAPTTIPAAGLDINTPVLVNDLDLWITGPDGTHLPWTLDPANPKKTADRAVNHVDNVEQVLIHTPVAGKYTIHVGHTGGSLLNNEQNYSLFISGLASRSNLVVDTLTDEDDGDLNSGDISLREAIRYAKPGEIVNFDSDLAGETIDLTLGELVVDKDLIINGLGADNLTISGNEKSRIFRVDDGHSDSLIDVEIIGLTISDGRASLLESNGTGGGIINYESLTVADSVVTNNQSAGFGAGISNNGQLRLVRSTVSNNKIENFPSSGGRFTSGGGLSNSNDSTLLINSSTISGNKANRGAGIINGGRLGIDNSTISGNIASTGGGGILNLGTANIGFTTIVENEANFSGRGNSSDPAFGGGIFNRGDGQLFISNTILAKNSDNRFSSASDLSPDVFSEDSASLASLGGNLIGFVNDNANFISMSSDQVGPIEDPLTGRDQSIDPLLGKLQDNGGPTFTHALLEDSSAIDKAAFGGIGSDQRGVSRPQGEAFDIGAFEFQTPIIGSDKVDTIAGGPGDQIIRGEGGDDVLRGDLNIRSPQGTKGGDDTIFGGDGNDRIGGKGGNDTLLGEVGDDHIWGDDGDDIIRGGLGNDTLTGDDFSGGQGMDTFILAVGEGTDIITDFEVGIDLIGLADGLTFGQLTLIDNNILANNEVLAILNGVETAGLTETSFTIV